MKPIVSFSRSLVLLLIFPVLFAVSCKDEVLKTRTYHTYVPVYIKTSEMRAQSIGLQDPKKLAVPGKIYIYGKYLLINEVNKGIHIVDNQDPSSPKFVNFINIPGNTDLAVNNNILYANNYIDLLAFNISDPLGARLVSRVDDVFPSYYWNKDKGIIVTYKDTVVTEVIKEENKGGVIYYDAALYSTSTGQSYGQGGSMARFTLMSSHLYTVDQAKLSLFNVANPAVPTFVNNINLGWGIETIFPYQNKLFIGSTTGMHIYDAANPAAPVKLSTYSHVTSCDPVVVSGRYAYVTLRSGNFCQQGTNLLEVLDIQDPASPRLVSSFAMQNPHGLGISGTDLFICEGDYGLKSYNASDIMKIGANKLQHIDDIKATDVIPGPKSLIVTGANGIYQYDYSNAGKLKLLSHIKIAN